MTIALLCPTRARPTQFKRMVKSVEQTSQGDVDIWTSISNEDFDAYEMPVGSVHYGLPSVDGMPTAYKWNRLAEIAMHQPVGIPAEKYPAKHYKLFMLCADDVVFSTPCWDKALLDHYNALENKIHVYHLRDSRNEDGTPHPVFTREWIEFFGFMLPPIFLHFYVDTWSVEIAKHAGCFTHLKDYQLIHDKCNDKGKPDETHSRIRQQGWVDRDRYVYEKCQHYMELEKKRLKDGIIGSMSMNQRFKSGVRAW